MPQMAIMRDAQTFEDPLSFRPFRFASNETLHATTKISSPETGDHSKQPKSSEGPAKFTDVNTKWLIWGLGNTAW